MNRWYKKTVTKAVLLVLAVLSGAVFVTNLFGALTIAGTANPAELWGMTDQSFEDTEDFNMQVENVMMEIMNQMRLENLFETDGAYNPDKVIDIMEYDKQGSGGVSGENVSGIAYTLEELESWSEDYVSGEGDIYDENGVIVCERPDGSYYYYYLSDFLTMFETGQLAFEAEDTDQGTILDLLEEGAYTTPGQYDFRIVDKEGGLQYTDCWNFGESLKEKYAPEGGSNLLQAVNENPRLNGKLTIIYENITYALSSLYSDLQTYNSGWDYLAEGNTNLTYLYINEETKRVVTNRSEYEDFAEAEENIEKMKEGDSVKYMVVYPKLRDFQTNMTISEANEWDAVRTYEDRRNFNSIFAVAVDTKFPIQDQFYEGKQAYDTNVPYIRNSLVISVIAAAAFLVCLVWLTLTAGRRAGDEKLHLTAFDRWKTEIAAALVIFIWAAGTGLFAMTWSGINVSISETLTYETGTYLYPLYYDTGMFTQSYDLFDTAGLFVYGVFTFSCFFAGYISLVRRIKGRRLWEDSVCRAFIYFGATVFRERSATARVGIILGVFVILQWFALASDGAPLFALVLLAADIAVIYLVLSNVIAKNRLKKGIEEIASGNMSYQISLAGLSGANRDLAEKINDIGSGLNKAVEEGMRNERLKTDLITNVSHDIKTPLTSIINYVDILKRSNINDPKIQGYLDILEAKAQRLKTLTEDVVEASKVSSGNISLECMDMDLRELVQQTEGEMAEKFEARNLTVVLNIPEEPAVIHVDGRRMWRVLENIFGNAAKYAMPGTRVYADMSVTEETVSFTLKNVSEQQLNITADELTERFIRGDISRSTEGSGLGLSIAKSLVQMQGGEFELYLDGDLFRVNIRFPRAYGRTGSAGKAEVDSK